MALVDFSFGGEKAATQAGQLGSQAALAGIPIQQQAFAGAERDIRPSIGVGQAALGSQAALAGLGPPGAQEAAFQQISESPGQRFIRERSQRNLLRNASAIGGLGGGNIRSALVEQGAGFALQDIEGQRQQLGQLSGRGLVAGTTLAQLGQQTAGSVADLQQAEAAARASGILGAQEAKSAGITDFAGVLTGIFG